MRVGRTVEELRPLQMEIGAAPYAEGSCLISFGNTRVLCTASIEEGLPSWRKESGEGWVTAEYAMLPRATHTRGQRERKGPGGRTQEIQRLIGRSLRSTMDMGALGARTILIDCDVLQADGGTRTASITGGCVALGLACRWLAERGLVDRFPLKSLVAAVSVGIVDGSRRLDLEYSEDVAAQVDMNVVCAANRKLIEVQGTAEGEPFDRSEFDRLLDLAMAGIDRLILEQAQLLPEVAPGR